VLIMTAMIVVLALGVSTMLVVRWGLFDNASAGNGRARPNSCDMFSAGRSTGVTLTELERRLRGLRPGTYAQIPYDLLAELFPPGEPDERTRNACYQFAKSVGCRVENKPDHFVVWLVKDATIS
jgi:hypothetical protein